MSDEFRIPYGCDARGALVSPTDAEKRVNYTCPSCGGRVDLHAGTKKRRHFHHRAAVCSRESVLHVTAKRLVVDAVEDWLAGRADPPVFVRACAQAGCRSRTRQAMPPKVGRAVEEHRLPSGFVADVALLARVADWPVAVVEIVHTHEVDDRKAVELGVPWIEVDAEQICADGGRVLVAVRDRLLPWLCRTHADTRGEPARRARHDRERAAAVARTLDYRISDFPGYRVERVVTCPHGHDALVFGWEGRTPPDPRPPHLVVAERALDSAFDAAGGWKKLLPFRRTFVSVCPSCGAQLNS